MDGSPVAAGIPRARTALPFIYVDRIGEIIESVTQNGGEIVKPPYAEGNLWVATIRDPAGNVMGIWQIATTGVGALRPVDRLSDLQLLFR